MNRRLKLLVLLLLAAVLCLSAAIASLAFAGSRQEPLPDGQQTQTGDNAVSLFVGKNGLWGAKAANGRVLIEPTWYYLRMMNSKSISDAVLIARRNDGKQDSFGLIRANGEMLVPFLYHSFESKDPDFWIAGIRENGAEHLHLYRADGTRWIDREFDSCEYKNRKLTLTHGRNTYEALVTEQGITWQNVRLDYPIGLHSLTLDFDAERLALISDEETVERLCSVTAQYLVYLFITNDAPDASLISAEDPAKVRAASLYAGCTLESAEISRLKTLETESFPQYLVQMQVKYRRREAGQISAPLTETSFSLIIGRNSAGDFTYSSFRDSQLMAAGTDML